MMAGMGLVSRRRHPDPAVDAEAVGRVRVDARTKRLVARLRPGEVAVIDHRDLDRVAAEALVAIGPAAVLNAAESTTERFGNLGPQVLVGAGVPLVDGCGRSLMELREGTAVRVDLGTGEVWADGRVVGVGQVQSAESVAAALGRSRAHLAEEMAAFARNTTEFMRAEAEAFAGAHDVSQIRTEMRGRHVLIVVRGYDHKEDLAVLKPYIRECRPVAVGVDGGADALVEAGVRPDVIVGDMDSVSDRTLGCGAELVVHAYTDGRAPGAERLDRLGLPYTAFASPGTSEDVAMIIADDKGADLIVAVGTHVSLIEFLDKGRPGMASTFLTRLRVGSKLVDAKGVSRLYRSRVSNAQFVAFAAMGVLALVAALDATAGGRVLLGLLGAGWDDVAAWLGGLFR
jgi:uncharacterized membrane-anchored protein